MSGAADWKDPASWAAIPAAIRKRAEAEAAEIMEASSSINPLMAAGIADAIARAQMRGMEQPSLNVRAQAIDLAIKSVAVTPLVMPPQPDLQGMDREAIFEVAQKARIEALFNRAAAIETWLTEERDPCRTS